MNEADIIRRYIAEKNLDCVLVNSTNEFLEEYTPLCENARYALTKFSGSTGDALVTADNIYLFVDGRYHIQADNEVDRNFVTVIKLQTGQSMLSEMRKLLPLNAKIGLHSKKNSQYKVEKFSEYFAVTLFDEDLISAKPEKPSDNIVHLNGELTGSTSEQKLNILRKNLNSEEAILISNPEEVSYLFNIRDFSKPYTSKVKAKAIITRQNARIYTNLKEYEQDLQKTEGRIWVDKSSATAYECKLAGSKLSFIEQNFLAKMKAIKTDKEIEHLKKAFANTDKAMSAIREYINTSGNISEYDIAQKLEEYFRKYDAKNLSFKSIVAKDKNAALAHYSKCSKNEIIKDGSLVLIDCGAYYEGGLATDITRVFVKGEPSELQKRIYTTVLKAFLKAFNYKTSDDTTGYDIDNSVRVFFNSQDTEGFEFNHGLGHGIGINVHEYPPNLSKNELAKVKIEEKMCFTIEPGLYKENYFGVRLENSCYFKDGKINSFSNMNFEKKLINYELLSTEEMKQLEKFGVK